MGNNRSELLRDVAGYYSRTLAEHGETPRGVDWNDEEGQTLRFRQLCGIITAPEFSLNDFGCGYGALYDYLDNHHTDFSYTGIDLSEEMVRVAVGRNVGKARARFIVSAKPESPADYGIASGIFNVSMGYSNGEWRDYLEETVELMHNSSRLGFAFNCLTSYSDEEKKRDGLYYADPCRTFDLCKKRYSRHVALLHDYGLYEFTILVRKAP
jgi:SAM-dependent methyltransferase